jgi:SOS-response transcriptional repressor LexA
METAARVPRYGETKFEVLAAVVDHWSVYSQHGPTVEEIRDTVGLSRRSSVQWHINSLSRDGFLENIPKKHRSLRPTDRGVKLVTILRELEQMPK